ncbi:hypothetical protein GCM10023200_50500 [Actinomycetospora chlora]|uniref:Transcriptional regulator, AbiEi antitoxin, Type IV TA system n=1 Tax=Actinomycetospora chlora TaxID=663608 RepID=A0ABP9CA05_9PSEU
MRRRRTIDWIAVGQAALHDQIRHADLLALGLSSSAITRRVHAGTWARSGYGVISLAGRPRTREQRWAAAVLYAGPGAVLSGVAAARLHGLERVPGDAEGAALVLIDHGRHRISRPPVTIERTHRLPTPIVVDGLPIAPVVRAVLDAARRLVDLDEIRALLAEAVQRGKASVRALRTELDQGCQRGTSRVRQVLGELEDGVRSVPEAWARSLVAAIPQLSTMVWNPRLVLEDGTWLADPDGWMDDVGLAWEIHSFRHHADPAAFDATMRRHARMTGREVHVVAHTPRQLRDDRATVRADLLAAYAVAARRPRPAVRALPPR